MDILTKMVFLILLCQATFLTAFLLKNNTLRTCEDAQPNCAAFDAFNICTNVDQARHLCAKHCKICDIVDGAWSVWGSWGQCDVSCGNGTKARVRKCDNPPPAHGGLDCQGDKDQTTDCVENPCPVHGGWGGWSLWGSCSCSCGFGIQRRDRACDNPWPSKDGNHCFGDSVDIRTCTDIKCSVGWSPWSEWNSCSVTCGTGLSQRSRSCQNALASLINNSCYGTPIEFKTCTNKACSSAFTATGYAPALGSASISFPHVILNEGNDYNSTTGVFKCRVPGLYLVTATIGKANCVSVDQVTCDIQHNGNDKLRLYHDHVLANDVDGYTSSASGTFRLQFNDHISIGSCVYRDQIYNSTATSFSAVLIRPD